MVRFRWAARGRVDGRTPGPRRRFAIDPRLVVGAILVAGSVAGVSWIVGSADRTVAVYAARSALYPGDRVTAGDLAVTRVRLGAEAERYLSVADLPADGAVISRAVGEGELLPSAAVGAAEGASSAAVVVQLSGPLSGAARPGTAVDLWAAERLESSRFGPPAVLVPGATIVRVVEEDGLMAGSGVALEVLVPRTSVARLLEAVSNEDAVAAVPVSVPLGN
ncbi:hypothetical protein ACFFGH_26350 [Lysobacter korlensis]|uniref:SAF domain-containing protein n=1 Tax=Lysobacter korlensis TaxID=553636 RepID=A0ABV6RWK1_9GAMM